MNTRTVLISLMLVLVPALSAAEAAGTYVLRDGYCNGSLVLGKSRSDKQSVSIKTLCGRKGQGCRFQGTGNPDNNVIQLKGPNCGLQLSLRGGHIIVLQKGVCSCDFNASMEGVYRRETGMHQAQIK